MDSQQFDQKLQRVAVTHWSRPQGDRQSADAYTGGAVIESFIPCDQQCGQCSRTVPHLPRRQFQRLAQKVAGKETWREYCDHCELYKYGTGAWGPPRRSSAGARAPASVPNNE